MISHFAMSFVFPQLIYTQRLATTATTAGKISQPLGCAASDEMNGPVADCSPGIACGWANDGVQSRWDPRPWAAGACGESKTFLAARAPYSVP